MRHIRVFICSIGLTMAGLTMAAFSGICNAGWFGPSNYDECILENMKGIADKSAVFAIKQACGNKFPMPKKEKTETCRDVSVTPDELSKIQIYLKGVEMNNLRYVVYNGNVFDVYNLVVSGKNSGSGKTETVYILSSGIKEKREDDLPNLKMSWFDHLPELPGAAPKAKDPFTTGDYISVQNDLSNFENLQLVSATKLTCGFW